MRSCARLRVRQKLHTLLLLWRRPCQFLHMGIPRHLLMEASWSAAESLMPGVPHAHRRSHWGYRRHPTRTNCSSWNSSWVRSRMTSGRGVQRHLRQPATPRLFQERGLHQLRETPTGGLLQNFAAEHPVGPYGDETMPPSEVASIVADVLGRPCTTERFAPSSLAATSVRPILEPRQIGACSLDAISVAPPLHPEGPTVAANILKPSYISDELAAVRILNAERGARTPAVTQPAFAAAARSGFAPIVRLDGSVLC
mmetsp:Transcript_28022/g.80411  ORF Transcript_28022/g.80411 Transcript_28022/m.80411 type:complete len:255 (-) Transcript_28022:259-1023(-)